MRESQVSGVSGVGGTGGGGGRDGGGWMGEAGGTSGPSLYSWDDVAVRVVAATSTTASGLFFRMTDETGASTLSSALQYPPQMAVRHASDGAFVAAHYDCAGPNLYRLGLYSCPGQSPSDEQATDAGCLAVVFGAQGARGNFVTGAGVSCAIDSATATASIDLPPPRRRERCEREVHARMRGRRQDPIEARRGLRAPGDGALPDLLISCR